MTEHDRQFPYASAIGVVCRARSVGIRPPSDLPAWQWMEREIVLDRGTSRLPGPYKTDLTPMVRNVTDAYQQAKTRRVVLMVSAQSAKTQLVMNLFNWVVNEDPDPSMWVMANADMMEEFLKKKLLPSIEHCEVTAEKIPADRRSISRGAILFDTMFLVMRGSNSRSKLQSDPIRNFFFDERREWAPGAIDLVRKRARSYENSRELSVGTAGVDGDELHGDWKEGSQTLFHWRCPHCQHSQPFRFGQSRTPIFEEEREKGGVKWDDNETTRPGGVWNFAELEKSVRYECEKCEGRITSAMKSGLLQTLHPVDYNPHAPDSVKSFHWNALYMPWPSCSFEELAKEFLKANEAQKIGNQHPLKAFVTETLGEPWRDERRQQLIRPPEHDGKVEVTTEKFRVMTIDVQKRDFWYVIRAWWPDSSSKLIAYGHVDSVAELNRIRLAHRVPAFLTAMDAGYNQEDTIGTCYQFREKFRGTTHCWKATKGERKDYYSETHDGKKVRRLFQPSDMKLTVPVPFWLIATTGCKDILFNLRDGRGAKWASLPGVSQDYLEQINSEEKVTEYKNGREIAFYDMVVEGRRNEFLDCESNNIALASWMGAFSVR